MSVLNERHAGQQITIECRRLSSFIISEADLLKVDVEGAEQLVLLDLAQSGELRLIKQIHLEYHHHVDAGNDIYR